MLGKDILDYIEAKIVMEELVGENVKYNKYKTIDMIILNHQLELFNNIVQVECLFYEDDSGGQIKFTGLNDLSFEFFRSAAISKGFRNYAILVSVIVYIDDDLDEVKMYNWLEDIYRGKNYAIS